jgi:hypothetical protein
MLEAMARIAPLQPSEAMARIASRRNGTIPLDRCCRVKIIYKVFLNVGLKWSSKVQIDSKREMG